MARSDKLAETHDRLVAAVEALASGEEWQKMLDTARRFHNYRTGRGRISEHFEFVALVLDDGTAGVSLAP